MSAVINCVSYEAGRRHAEVDLAEGAAPTRTARSSGSGCTRRTRSCCAPCSSASTCTTSRSRTRCWPISARSSRSTATRSSSRCAPRSSSTRRSSSARRTFSRAAATWSPCATARPPPIARCARAAKARRRCWRWARASSSIRSSTSSSTTTFPVLHELETEADALEEEVFAHRSDPTDVERIYELRHELLLLRRAVQPLQEVCNRIMRYDVPLIDHAMNDYFRDIQDHVIRVVEGIDNLRDLLNRGARSEPAAGLAGAEPGDQEADRMGGDPVDPAGDRVDLRDELQADARTRAALRLSGRHGGHHRAVRLLVLPFPARGLALGAYASAVVEGRCPRTRATCGRCARTTSQAQ